MAESDDTSCINRASGEESDDSSDGDAAELLFRNEMINLLSLDDNEEKDDIIDDLLENGRQSLIKYQENIISKIYKEVMNDNDSMLIILFKKYLETSFEAEWDESYPWLISFFKEYKNGENHDIYDRVFTRAANYGTTYMKDCPILSLVLQLLFEGIDDDCLKKTNVFNDLWFTITNDGLKSITKFSDYIVKSVMNEQLKSQSTLFQALRVYYREDVFSSLTECNIVAKGNLYELALDDVVEHGWLSDVKSIEDNITPRAYKMLLEKLRSFHKEAKPSVTEKPKATKVDSQEKPTSSGKDTTPEKKKDNEEQNPLFYGMDATEKEIFTLINNHRRQYGLPSLEPSVNLAYVAHTHAIDVVENSPDVGGGNMHSWSNKGKWKPVRYTSDHQQAKLMWSKPSEISNYKFDGFEISHGYTGPSRKTTTVKPPEALNSWKNSSGHNAVMVQQGVFHHPPMKVMGVGVYKGYACVWFGREKDTFPAPS